MSIFSTLMSKESLKQRTETLNALSFFGSVANSMSIRLSSGSIADDVSPYNNTDNVFNVHTAEFYSSLCEVEESILAVAVNNYAICALNLRKIKVRLF